MLKIRSTQMNVFDEAALRCFEDDMVVHSEEFSPRLCEVIGEAQLRVALRQAMKRADAYGFTNRGPIRLYIELMFLYGSHFDSDPQYPALGRILNLSGEQMLRAEQMYDQVLDYQEKVSGPEGVNVHKALEALSHFARQPSTFSENGFASEICRELTRIFPQKAAYIGDEMLQALIAEGRTEAQRYGFTSLRGEALLVALMYAFGHGCTDDPIYPWISQTLRDPRITDSTARARRLERKAKTWLDHVLVRLKRGTPT
ncbi:MAG: hypothetical protein GY703_12530 [Gammaproteobacteria bacterium]|nr:hypothetical protein [Gammaproteobacteria bacterium]